jgi:CheY-like chemotaxis protein
MSGALSIIKEHSGKMYVKDTVPGKGTTIEIILPLLPYSEHEVIKKIEEPEEKLSSHESPVRILWVEDDTSISEMVSEMIKLLNYNGDIANSGKKALEYLEHNVYDLIITDIGMPEIDGWQLADIIKEKFAGKMKVVVASGWDFQISETEKAKHGVVDCLGKPFNFNQLQKIVKEVAQV